MNSIHTEFYEAQRRLQEDGIGFQTFHTDEFIDIIRYEHKVLGSLYSNPFVVEVYLNKELYARIPCLSKSDSDILLEYNHKRINFFAEIHFNMQKLIAENAELARKNSEYVNDYVVGLKKDSAS